MRNIFYVTIIAMIFIASNAVAGSLITNRTIQGISTGYGGEGVYIDASPTPTEGCGGQRLFIAPGDPLFNENLAVLLSAFHANTTVSFYVDGCAAGQIHLKATTITK